MLSTSLIYLLVSNTKYYITYVMLALASLIYVYSYNISIMITNNSYLLFNSTIAYDSLSSSILIVASIVTLWLLSSYRDFVNTMLIKYNNELIGLMVLLVISLAGLATSNSFLSILVTVELQSLVLYIMLASPLNKQLLNNVSKVSLSYLINAAIATGFLLFGFGTNSHFLILVAILWKLGIVPVHVWSLPILDNINSILAAAYLTLAKYGLLVVIGLLASTNNVTGSILVYLGLTNLVIANVLGLLQFRYQRIITYSSLIQLGYMMLALSYSTSLAVTYFELYGFYTVLLLLLWTAPSYAQLHGSLLLPKVQLWILVFTLYTVAGLPWMPLFWTKLEILLQLNSQSLTFALISTLLASLIYVRLIKFISFYRQA